MTEDKKSNIAWFVLSVLLGTGGGSFASKQLLEWRIKALEDLTKTERLVKLESRLTVLEESAKEGERFTQEEGDRVIGDLLELKRECAEHDKLKAHREAVLTLQELRRDLDKIIP